MLLVVAFAAPGLGSGQTVERDWLDAGFEKAEVRRVPAAELAAPTGEKIEYTLPVSFIRLAGSNWTHARVMRHVSRTVRIFAACGIGLGPVEIIEAQAPDGRHDLDMEIPSGQPAPEDVVKFSAMAPASALRPPVYFVGRLLNDEALARSFRRGDVSVQEATGFAYLDTSWVAFKTHWMERKDDEYSTVAHELAHLLCECGHERSREPHLLNRYRNFLSSHIQPETCERMRKSPLLEPLPIQATPPAK